MKTSRKVILISLFLLVIAGASLQVRHWYEPRGSGWRGAGQMLIAVSLALLAMFFPQRSRAFHSMRYSRKFNLLIGALAICATGVLLLVVYSHYYGPLMQAVNSTSGE